MIRPAAIVLTLIAADAAALDLIRPIDCSKAGGCYVQSLPDRDPGPGARDYACGTLSYDGHAGVDFRVRTMADLAVGRSRARRSAGCGARRAGRRAGYRAEAALIRDGAVVEAARPQAALR